MAALVADWTDGIGSIETTTITNPIIDNETHYYLLYLEIDPDAAVDDAHFYRAKIDWE